MSGFGVHSSTGQTLVNFLEMKGFNAMHTFYQKDERDEKVDLGTSLWDIGF